jgi:hypothetical protein
MLSGKQDYVPELQSSTKLILIATVWSLPEMNWHDSYIQVLIVPNPKPYTAISYSWLRTSSKLPTCLSHTLISLSVPKCFIFLVQEHNKSYTSIS